MKIKLLELELKHLFECVDRLELGINTFDDIGNEIYECLSHSIRDLYVICQNAEHGNFPANHVSIGLERAMEMVRIITDDGINVAITNKRGYDNRCRVAFLALLGLIHVYFDLKKPASEDSSIGCELNANGRKRVYEMTNKILLEMNFEKETESSYLTLIGKCKNRVSTSNCGKLPKELDNHKAKEILQRGIKAGLLDDNYQLLKGVTQGQAHIFALYASQELRIFEPWKVFGILLWGMNNLGKVKPESTREKKLAIVRGLFSDKIVKEAMKK